jgi:hypothetical protein
MTKNIKHKQDVNFEGLDLDVQKPKGLENTLNISTMHVHP